MAEDDPMLGELAQLINANYFSMTDFKNAEAAIIKHGADPNDARFYFVPRYDLSGMPFQLYSIVEIGPKDKIDG
jgi:hypothetical protein